MAGLTILIFVADSEIRESLRAAFAVDRSFASCREAENALQALREAEQAHPSLVILDLATSLENTLQLAQCLRQIVPRIPIFMLTNQYDCMAEKRALSSGITAMFSEREDPRAVLANARAVCDVEFGEHVAHAFAVGLSSSVFSLP